MTRYLVVGIKPEGYTKYLWKAESEETLYKHAQQLLEAKGFNEIQISNYDALQGHMRQRLEAHAKQDEQHLAEARAKYHIEKWRRTSTSYDSETSSTHRNPALDILQGVGIASLLD